MDHKPLTFISCAFFAVALSAGPCAAGDIKHPVKIDSSIKMNPDDFKRPHNMPVLFIGTKPRDFSRTHIDYLERKYSDQTKANRKEIAEGVYASQRGAALTLSMPLGSPN